MRSPGDIKRSIEERLRGYLSRDHTGIRRELLNLFVRIKSLTVPLIFEEMQQHYEITYHSIASMVGTIASRLGILHVRKPTEGNNCVYELKEKYLDLVTRVMQSAA